MKLFPYRPNQRNHLVLVAVHNFPSGLFKTSLGITLLATPYILNYLSEQGMTSLTERTIVNGLIVLLIPAALLFIITLIRSPSIRRRKEAEVETERQATVTSLHAIEAQEQKEEKEIVRLQQVVTTDTQARLVKDAKDEERWDMLNERLRVQDETGQHNIDLKEEREVARQELASEERILVAQLVKDIKDEGDIVRKELVSDALIAKGVKSQQEDERWDSLNDKLRVQEEREVARQELASEERILVAQQVKDIKDEGDIVRKELVSDALIAKGVKSQQEDERWDSLNDKLRIQEEREVARQELASEERLLVARQVRVIKDEGDALRKELVSDELIAQGVKDRKEDERWDSLNENLRIRQEEAGKRSDDLKVEREVVRQKLASGVLRAQRDKDQTDEERWSILHERLRIQEELSHEREALQLRRDAELREMFQSLMQYLARSEAPPQA